METQVDYFAHNFALRQTVVTPAADECIFYERSFYGGASVSVKGYKHTNLSRLSFDNKAWSWKCGSEVYALFCDSKTPYNDRCDGDLTNVINGASQAGRISNPNAGSRAGKISDVILKKYNELE